MNDSEELTARVVAVALKWLQEPAYWWQVGAIVVMGAAAWLAARALAPFFKPGEREFGPTALVAVSLARRTTFLVLLGLGCIAAAGVLLRLGLPYRLVWIVALLVALYVLGWTDTIATALDSFQIPIGEGGFSLLQAFNAALTLILFLVAGAWLGAVATRSLMSSTRLSIGLRVGIAKFLRLFLILVAALVGLSAVGIDLSALAVFSGALGIGLGFGLQRIAANFVSGFILIGDRSIRQGDVITIGNRFGVVRELRARYMVVRDRDGVDTLIPNENVISNEVVNWSYSDRAVRLKLPVQISYGDNPRTALALLLKAANAHPRVLKHPIPASRVMGFDENGINNVRSDLHRAVWDLFMEGGITIPFPQRDLHLRSGWPAPPR